MSPRLLGAACIALAFAAGAPSLAQVPPLPPVTALPSGAGARDARPVVAVLPVSLVHLPRLDARAETTRIREAFERSGRFRVLSEGDTTARLKGAGVRDERCLEIECAVEFGQAMKVHKLLTAQVLQLGRRTLIRVRYVDVAAAKAELAEQAEFVGDAAAIPSVLRQVIARAYSATPSAPTLVQAVALTYDPPETPFYTRPWFYITVGAVVAAGAAAGLALGLRSGGPNTGASVFNWLRAK